MEPSQSDRRRKRLRKCHEIFASEVVDYFQQYFQFKPNEDKNYYFMTKATGDAIATIFYLFRNETWKMCRDMRDYIVIEQNFVNYCKVIRVDGGSRFYYNYLRRVSIILQIASFCFIKGHDFFKIASKYIGMYEYRDLQLFEDRGGWRKLYKVAEFIGSCGDRLNMVMDKDEPSKKPENFIDTVIRVTPSCTSEESNYKECFPYIMEIRWKLVIDDNTRSLEDPESSTSSDDHDDDDENRPDASARPGPSKLAQERRLEYAARSRPSTSREEVSSSREVKDPRIQIEGDDEKAILDYFLRCVADRKKLGHFGESADSEASNTNSLSTESEAENVREYSLEDSSDSEDEFRRSSRLQLVDLKELRRKKASESSSFGQRGKPGTSRSTSAKTEDEPRCSGVKIPKFSNRPMFAAETDTSDELESTSDDKSRSPH